MPPETCQAPERRIGIGIDVGGTTFTVCAVERDGARITDSTAPIPATDDPSEMIARIAAAAAHLMTAVVQTHGAPITGIGVGVPGTVSPDLQTVIDCPNLTVLNGLAVPEMLSARFGLPAFLHNDAYCAALGELRYGAGRGHRNVLVVTLGTGVGGGVAIDNRVLRGPRGVLGEIGHIIIDPDGPRCTCGARGCLEAVVGRDGIVARARNGLAEHPHSRLADMADAVTPQLIAGLAAEGDDYCRQIIDWIGECVGLALADAIVMCDPDVILVGGGIARAGRMLLDAIRHSVGRHSRIAGFDPSNVIACGLGAGAGAVGAAALIWEQTGPTSWDTSPCQSTFANAQYTTEHTEPRQHTHADGAA